MKDKIICYCSMVSEGSIMQAIKEGAKTLDDIRKATSACTLSDCKNKNPKKACCSLDIINILEKQKKGRQVENASF